MKAEAKKRNQPLASLARTFIRDGLAQYDAISEELMQADERIEARLLMIQSLVAANLHVAVEGPILARQQKSDEAGDAYVNRLRDAYRDTVLTSIRKGDLIAEAAAAQLENAKPGSGRR